ncbi:MAG: hypothetical protein Q9187_005393, partial [Circinaria calcarea]
RLGNPREVVLKVTELLEAITHEENGSGREQEDATDEENEHIGSGADEGGIGVDSNAHVNAETAIDLSQHAGHPRPVPPSSAMKFCSLLSMLSILHPRIKTKHPSRFLSTSLHAMLPAYTQVARDELATDAVLSFLKTITGSKRPKLPPRMSSTAVPMRQNIQSAPDPEAGPETPGTEDAALQIRLLQSFLTYVIEAYVDSLTSINNDSAFAWTSRLQEKLHPQKIIPHRTAFGAIFAETEHLQRRDTTIGQMIALARDLNIHPLELIVVISHVEVEAAGNENEIASSPSDIHLSHTGSLYLFAAMQASCVLFDAPSLLHLDIFPNHSRILESFIGDANMNGIGAERGSLVDAVLLLGFVALQEPSLGELGENEDFNRYLQRLSVLSANTPSPSLRYHAHILTTAVLHAHPNAQARFDFIRDTLDQCPYESLKASAVGWFKDEVLSAFEDTRGGDPLDKHAESPHFGSAHALDAIAPSLFLVDVPSSAERNALSLQMPFFLSILNLYYLLCSSQPLRDRLCVATATTRYDILGNFIGPLRELVKEARLNPDVQALNLEEAEPTLVGRADIDLLDEALERVETAMHSLDF